MFHSPLTRAWQQSYQTSGEVSIGAESMPFAEVTEYLHGRQTWVEGSRGTWVEPSQLQIGDRWPELVPEFSTFSLRAQYSRFSSSEALLGIKNQILRDYGSTLSQKHISRDKKIVLEVCKQMLTQSAERYFGTQSNEVFVLSGLPIQDWLETQKILASERIHIRLGLAEFITSEFEDSADQNYKLFLMQFFDLILEPLLLNYDRFDEIRKSVILGSVEQHLRFFLDQFQGGLQRIDVEQAIWRLIFHISNHLEVDESLIDMSFGVRVPDRRQQYYYIQAENSVVWNDYAMKLMYKSLMFGSEDHFDDSVRNTRPLHSLADFNPDMDFRIPRLLEKSHNLHSLIAKYGLDRDRVLNEFLFSMDEDGCVSTPRVIQFANMKVNLLVQGHHRIAALIDFANKGLIPQSWLENLHLPSVVYRGDDEPEHVVYYFCTAGQNKTWQDVIAGR